VLLHWRDDDGTSSCGLVEEQAPCRAESGAKSNGAAK
jgi:hypothetical protein